MSGTIEKLYVQLNSTYEVKVAGKYEDAHVLLIRAQLYCEGCEDARAKLILNIRHIGQYLLNIANSVLLGGKEIIPFPYFVKVFS